MCGAYYLRQSQQLRAFFGLDSEAAFKDFLQLRLPIENPRRLVEAGKVAPPWVFRPTDPIPIIVQNRQGNLELRAARWWLVMEQDDQGDWQPLSKFASFNSRVDKVLSPERSTHTQRPKSFRVVIPAQGYIEWSDKVPHAFERSDGQPLLLGGMAKAYPRPDGTFQLAASLVTLPGHPKTQHIHAKSIPLLLEDEEVTAWLDRSLPHQHFQHYREPALKAGLSIQPWRSIKDPTPVGPPETVEAD